ncbi:putative Translation initiation factor eIF-2B subunit beta [Paratrimastix pyriformis]|uniref:Translation initiation factor eIF2B subunit beta n=1 Tax=Paratrimastix pyriformis TaxID=342808 RepID=A0ABQ8UGE5_9EUKA|nr:putative Translation initiation factor eIF-2B subunit beta [Paratrimastix pyriformis]
MSELTPAQQQHVLDFTARIKNRKFTGSLEVAVQTAKLLKRVIEERKSWQDSVRLKEIIRKIGSQLAGYRPVDLVMGNIIRRVLHIIREEEAQHIFRPSSPTDSFSPPGFITPPATPPPPLPVPSSPIMPGSPPLLGAMSTPGSSNRSRPVLKTTSTLMVERHMSLRNLFEALPEAASAPADVSIKDPLVEQINELIGEIETHFDPICKQALEHIYQSEVILTYGYSKTVERFFLHAKEAGRHFEVIVVEGAPNFEGRRMAKALVQQGIPTHLITDAACFLMMSRVNKVVIGTSAVVLTGLYKLSPLFPNNQDNFNELLSPADILPYSFAAELPNLHIVNPRYDYIPPEYVSLFITNSGGHGPSYIYRLLAELYSPEDYALSNEAADEAFVHDAL